MKMKEPGLQLYYPNKQDEVPVATWMKAETKEGEGTGLLINYNYNYQ
ncbi:MAG: hypothetical protein WBP16_08590 [Ferruginibacter sp.]